MTDVQLCPCGSGNDLSSCCGPFLSKTARPTTAEQLMRARYTAFALGNIDFIINSHHEKSRSQIDRSHIEAWSKQSEWLSLEILSTELGKETDTEGLVEFVARYKVRGAIIPHRERAIFTKEDGVWFFVDGQDVKGAPVKSTKVAGRNDPCTCGSGKKYKKCCGKAA